MRSGKHARFCRINPSNLGRIRFVGKCEAASAGFIDDKNVARMIEELLPLPQQIPQSRRR